MTNRAVGLAVALLMTLSASATAQTGYRIRGAVKDDAGAPVAGAKVRVEAVHGFRGEPFSGARQFETKTNDKGEWNLLGLTSGIWVFEATAEGVAPHVIALPVQLTSRETRTSQTGALNWQVPLTVRRTKNEHLLKASAAAMAGDAAGAANALAPLQKEPDNETLCAAGEIAILIRQTGLADAIFREVSGRDAKNGCGLLGQASIAFMTRQFERAGKLVYDARENLPKPIHGAISAAIADLQRLTQ